MTMFFFWYFDCISTPVITVKEECAVLAWRDTILKIGIFLRQQYQRLLR